MKFYLSILLSCIFIPSCASAPLPEMPGQQITYFYSAPSDQAFQSIQKSVVVHEKLLRSQKKRSDILISVWIARISEKYGWPIAGSSGLSKQAKEILEGKSRLARYVSNDAAVDARKLDIWWASFFATGEEVYLDKILLFAGEDINKAKGRQIIIIGAAGWSFKANCKQHKAVRSFAEKKLKSADFPHYKTRFLQECINNL